MSTATRARTLFRLLAGASLAVLLAPGQADARTGKDPVDARSLLGSYLAGRIARGQHDTPAASQFYGRALQRDPSNEALIEQALIMEASEGRFDDAFRLARQLHALQPNHRMAQLMLGLSEAKAGRHAAADEHFKASGTGLIGELTSALSRAWGLTAQGDSKAAIDLLDGVKQAEWTQHFLRYHKALILDVSGRRAEARAAYERIFRTDPKTMRTTLAYAQHASASGEQKLARSILEEHAKKIGGTPHPMAKAVQDQLKGNERTGLLVTAPAEGLAEAFYGLGELLSGDGGLHVAAIYLQMALHLQPGQPLALAALANIYETTKRYDAAIASYEQIPRNTPLQAAVDIRKALNLNQLERVDEAKALLEQLADTDRTDVRALDALGNIMRGRKRYQEAADYYTRAIAIIGPKPDRKHWTYFYARGTCYERLKKWPQAEADLLKAMQLSPDQPLVLNYLGYSWVDQNRNLKAGLQMIEKAVSLKPDDGYIVDSLGWAHYRLGNYKEAVKHLEKAVELKPEDPVLNDHLGDAFWRVGREIEARFQWEQALTLKPEEDDVEKIRAKIAKGLPAKPPARVVKKSKEPVKAEGPKRQTKLGSQRPPE